jgi:hypothetical protein
MRKCDGCGKRKFKPAPMLRDEVWNNARNQFARWLDEQWLDEQEAAR